MIMMTVLRLLSFPGLNRGESSGTGYRWIRGLLARNPCAIGIQPVHTRVDSCGLPLDDLRRRQRAGMRGIACFDLKGGVVDAVAGREIGAGLRQQPVVERGARPYEMRRERDLGRAHRPDVQ